MAFNPFHAFRKHQKTLLAGLTILAMVTFILSSGTLSGGDFFGEMLRLFGGRGRATEAATVYGRRIPQQELAFLRQQRLLASQYMTLATQTALGSVQRELYRALEKDKPMLQELQQALLFASFGEFQRHSLDQLNLLRMRLEGAGKKSEAELLGRFMLLFSQQMARMLRGPNELYFGGQDRTDDLLDFLIWRHQADLLGIQLTTSDIRNEIERETLGQLTLETKAALEKHLRRDQQMLQSLPSALEEEFRVRLAKAALLGEHPGTYRIPAPVTPYDFWEFFRKNRTEVSATVLPIPVQDFVAKVEDKPTEEELNALFAKYKDVESTPDSPTPGFKLPRRVQVEWVAIQPESPHYRRATTLAASAILATWPGAWQARLLDEYESVKYLYRLPPLNDPGFVLSTYTLLVRPTDVAGMVGLAASAPVDFSSAALSALVGYQGTIVLRETKDLAPLLAKEAQKRIPGGVTQVLAWSAASILPSFGSPLASFADPLAMLSAWQGEKGKDQFMPYDMIQRQVAERVHEGLAKELIQSALTSLKKEIENRKTRPEEAHQYVEEAIQKYALQRHGTTTQLRDRYDIGSDKGLAPLKEAYLQPPARDPKGKNFAELFFRTPGGLYTPERWPSEGRGLVGDEPVFLYWRTDDKPARVPDVQDVKDQVAEAWRFEKARVLARAKAQEIEEQVRKQAGDVWPTLKEVGDKHSWKPFDLFAVSRLQDKPTAAFSPKQYEPYRVPEDQVEYPSTDFVDRLLKLKEKGDVAVLHNKPESIYYVAALTQNAKEPSPQSFFFAYKDASNPMRSDQLLSLREREQRDQYYLAFMKELRAQAHLSINEEMRKRSKEESGDLTE